MNSFLCKALRVTAIILMGITVTFTLLGAIGTTCAAFATERFDSMLPLAPYKWLYQLLVVISLAVGIAGIRTLVRLVRASPQAYREAIIFLLVAGLAALVQVVASRMLRGKSMPTDIRLYANLLTLLVFLLLRIPAIWQGTGFAGRGQGVARAASGLAAIVAGVMALSVQWWAAPAHTFNGFNYADIWHTALSLLGGTLILIGAVLLLWGMDHQTSSEHHLVGQGSAARS